MKPVIMCLGMPRSGTTWLAKIIDSHPSVLYSHEPDSVYPLKGVPLLCNEYFEKHKTSVVNLLKGLPYQNEKCLGKKPFFKKKYRSFFAEKSFQAAVLASKILGGKIIFSQKKHALNPDSVMFFKSIESMGRVELFLTASDELRIIYIVRSVFGQINSVIKGSTKGEFTDNEMLNLRKKELEQLYKIHGAHNKDSLKMVLSFSAIEQLAYRWLVYNEKALIESSRYSGRVLVVVYDELCDQPKKWSEKVFDFIGLPLDEQSKQFIKKSTLSHSDLFYSVTKDPKKAKSSWKKSISSDDVQRIKAVIEGSKSAAIIGCHL